MVSFSQPINALQCHSHGSGTRGDGNHCSLWTYTDLPTGASFSQVSMHLQVFFSISHRLSVVGLRLSSSLFTGCAVPLRGDWAIFCHVGSRRVGGVWSAREKSLGIPHRGWELNPGRREDRQWAIPLSYHDWVATMLQLYHHFKIVKGHNHSRSSQYQLQICESSLFIICSLNHSSSEGT